MFLSTSAMIGNRQGTAENISTAISVRVVSPKVHLGQGWFIFLKTTARYPKSAASNMLVPSTPGKSYLITMVGQAPLYATNWLTYRIHRQPAIETIARVGTTIFLKVIRRFSFFSDRNTR